MIETLAAVIVTAILIIVSLCIGYSLGKNQKPVSEKIAEEIRNITNRKITQTSNGVGAITRPTQVDIDRYNNPEGAAEEDAMSETLSNLIKK